MVVVDTSTWIAYFAGESGKDVDLADQLLAEGRAILVPPVLAEILSDPRLPNRVESAIMEIPCLPLNEGFWTRVGKLRRRILLQRRKAPLVDVLIAQCCIDHNITLLSRDADFKMLSRLSRLQLAQI